MKSLNKQKSENHLFTQIRETDFIFGKQMVQHFENEREMMFNERSIFSDFLRLLGFIRFIINPLNKMDYNEIWIIKELYFTCFSEYVMGNV